MCRRTITVCVPTYNASRFLDRCLRSLEIQTFKDFSVIFVDDASEDGTVEILKDFLEHSDLEVEIVERSVNSGGMALAVQETMKSCATPYYTWLGADDELAPSYLSELLRILESNPDISYAYCDYALIDKTSQVVGGWNWPIVSYLSLLQHVLHTQSGCLPFNGLFRMSFVQENLLDFLIYKGESFSSDTLNALHFMSMELVVEKLPKPLFRYRQHRDQASKDYQRRLISDINVLEYLFLFHRDMVNSLVGISAQDFAKQVSKSLASNQNRFHHQIEEIRNFIGGSEYRKVLTESLHRVKCHSETILIDEILRPYL